MFQIHFNTKYLLIIYKFHWFRHWRKIGNLCRSLIHWWLFPKICNFIPSLAMLGPRTHSSERSHNLRPKWRLKERIKPKAFIQMFQEFATDLLTLLQIFSKQKDSIYNWQNSKRNHLVNEKASAYSVTTNYKRMYLNIA